MFPKASWIHELLDTISEQFSAFSICKLFSTAKLSKNIWFIIIEVEELYGSDEELDYESETLLGNMNDNSVQIEDFQQAL